MEEEEKDVDNVELMQLILVKIHNERFNRSFNSIHNPIYSTLSKKLNVTEEKIYKAVRELQPSLVLKRYRYIINRLKSTSI